MVRVSAPGKCILFGEHAVVYGHPAVAVAIDQRLTVNAELSSQWDLDGKPLNAQKHPHVEALKSRMWAHGPPLRVSIYGDIPAGSGLGSSASLSAASASCLRMLRGRYVDAKGNWAEGWSSTKPNNVYSGHSEENFGEKRLRGWDAVSEDESALLAHAVEAFAQGGMASPIDSSTCSHGGCIVAFKEKIPELDWLYTRKLKHKEAERKWELHRLVIPEKLHSAKLVIGHTGIHGSTAKQVEMVRNEIQQNPSLIQVMDAIGQITKRGIDALLSADLVTLGQSMNENHYLLQGLNVSCPELDALVEAAQLTSFGAKLTGAGGGGCMIALTSKPVETSRAIELAGGRAFVSSLGGYGLRCEDEVGSPSWDPHEI